MLFVLLLILAVLVAGWSIWLGGLWLALLWLSAALIIVAFAWIRRGHEVFGKRPDGRRALTSTIILLPYLLLIWSTWRIALLASRESAYDRIDPGLLLGRRSRAHESVPCVDVIVDLTCEFSEPSTLSRRDGYICFPVIDGAPPRDAEGWIELVQRIDWPERSVFVHCAQGHGRTATLAISMLLYAGRASTVDEALSLVRAARPGAGLGSAQRTFLMGVCARLKAPAAPDGSDEQAD